MPDWDYFALDLDPLTSPRERQQPLIELGNKGWELVTVASYTSIDTGPALIAFFKRPRSSE